MSLNPKPRLLRLPPQGSEDRVEITAPTEPPVSARGLVALAKIAATGGLIGATPGLGVLLGVVSASGMGFGSSLGDKIQGSLMVAGNLAGCGGLLSGNYQVAAVGLGLSAIAGAVAFASDNAFCLRRPELLAQ